MPQPNVWRKLLFLTPALTVILIFWTFLAFFFLHEEFDAAAECLKKFLLLDPGSDCSFFFEFFSIFVRNLML